MQRFTRLVKDGFGNPAAGAQAFVVDAATGNPSTLYSASDGALDPTTAIGNPVVSGADGKVAFAAPNGRYTVYISGGNCTPWSEPWITMMDQAVPTNLSDTTDTANGDALIGVKQPFTGAGPRTQHDKNLELVSVLDFFANGVSGALVDPTGAIDSTAGIAAALAAVPAHGTLYFPAGTYLGTMSVRRSNITILGAGSASTILKASTLSTGGVIELGDTASGNSAAAYTNVNVRGITVDGNYLVIPAPTDDLHGHGIIQTKISYSFIEDVVCVDCHKCGLDTAINSNFNHIQVMVKNCGNAVGGGGHYPNFDCNSSKYSIYDVISDGGYYAARLLDNVYGCHLRVAAYNPGLSGVLLNNQTVNESHGNIVDAIIIGGCANSGVNISYNWRNGIINASISDITGIGFQEFGVNDGIAASNVPTGNIYNVSTRNGQSQSCYIGSDYNTWNIHSYQDGRGGAVGSYFSIDVQGTHNTINAFVHDTSSWQVRGLSFRASSAYNQLVSYDYLNTLDPIQVLGTANSVNHTQGQGADIASAATITIPWNGNVFSITGTTGISAISPTASNKGRIITLRFTASLTVTNGASLKLAGAVNFSATADDCLTLMCDGSVWTEVSRSIN